MEPSNPPKTSPIITLSDDSPVNSCSFDSQCALKPKDRFQIAAFAALAIALVSAVMFGFYWIATKFF